MAKLDRTGESPEDRRIRLTGGNKNVRGSKSIVMSVTGVLHPEDQLPMPGKLYIPREVFNQIVEKVPDNWREDTRLKIAGYNLKALTRGGTRVFRYSPGLLNAMFPDWRQSYEPIKRP